MKKQGAIILGIGGDNSNGSAGTFYEGVMTTGVRLGLDRGRRPGQHRRRRLLNLIRGGGGATGTIVSGVSSSVCMDNNNGSGANGNKVQIWACDGYAPAQNWTVNTNGTITIDGGCLDITGAKYSNGTLVELWTCNGGANQQWKAENGELVNPTSGQCLDDPDGSTTERDAAPDIRLLRRLQPEVDRALTRQAPAPPLASRRDKATAGQRQATSKLRLLRPLVFTAADSERDGHTITWRPAHLGRSPSRTGSCFFGCRLFEAAREHWDQMPAAVEVSAATDIKFSDDTLRELGQVGLGVGQDADATGVGLGASDITINGSAFTDDAGGGIVVGGVQLAAPLPGFIKIRRPR